MNPTVTANGKNNPLTQNRHYLLDDAADHWNHQEYDDDYYSQPGKLFKLMTPEQQQVLFENFVRSFSGVPRGEIRLRHCTKADPAYGASIDSRCQHIKTPC